ncbi:hypothetical protein [Nocardioides daeguensis]|uniref:Alpha-amylase n=1 Tax=Nocardioides daeguensis TaxID=908359 RepID=A0ABP6W753_9ACTN|nr:hypothetical protein [Nocardioides daeguensis]MBV6729285.1 hypothetical protein [Nocardioides daeguensis]MCR1774261.1 hypothetical protein [Nocardioides daeguensis]
MRKQLLGAVVAATTALLGLGTLPAPTAHAATPLGAISGTVTAEVGGLPLDNIKVVAFQQLTEDGVTGWGPVRFAETQPTGTYVLYAEPGTYRLGFVECAQACADPTYAPEFYDDVATVAEAKDLTVTDNEILPGIDAALAPGRLVSGHVSEPDDSDAANALVAAYADGTTSPTYTAKADADGDYALVVPAGSYRFGFVDAPREHGEFYADKRTLATADAVPVDADVPNLDIHLDLPQVRNVAGGEPAVNGIPRVGDTLAAAHGVWYPFESGYTFTYEWFRSGSAVAIGAGATLVVPPAAQGGDDHRPGDRRARGPYEQHRDLRADHAHRAGADRAEGHRAARDLGRAQGR